MQGAALWQERTKLEKNLIGSIFLFVVIFVITSSYIVFFRSSTCLKERCIHAASEILNSVDRKINPCDDFHAFVCNRWISNNPLPNGIQTLSAFTKLDESNQLVIKNVLERPIVMFKSDAEKKAKLYYESCLDRNATIEKLGAQPMLKLIQDLGGWNVISTPKNSFDVSNWSLETTLKVLKNKYYLGGLFMWEIMKDKINIVQDGISLPGKKYYLSKEHLATYIECMAKIAVFLGADKMEAKKQMQAVIDFETKLAEITELLGGSEQQMTLKQLQDLASLIDWRAHFEDAFKNFNRKISEKELVVVHTPKYLADLTRIVKNYTSTNEGKIVLNNYLIWRTVKPLIGTLPKPFHDACNGFEIVSTGNERWPYCVSDTSKAIGFAVGAMFVREVFNVEAKPQAEEMINNVRLAFKENVKNLEWIDAKTRVLAAEKADAIIDMIGYPDYILNPQLLDESYKGLDIDPNNYFENKIKYNVFDMRKNLEQWDQPLNETEWKMAPQTLNAYYSPLTNEIGFPAAILQLPFFDISNPKSLNYGGIGAIMGHELTHAFDNKGRQYDKFGNLRQWWDNKTIERFEERAKCFIKQYDQYSINGIHVNGKQTLGENVADNGGIKAAFNAYIKTKKVDEIDTHSLPGIDMTHRQLFFVSLAQIWCSAVTDQMAYLQILVDVHSPFKFRINGALSNLKEFSDEFNCERGSPMNPTNKCELW